MATWRKYRERLEELILKYKKLFPDFRRGTIDYDDLGVRHKGNIFIDEWGCVWKFEADGLQGQVVKHPLENWNLLNKLKIPDPEEGLPVEGGPMVPWSLVEKRVKETKARGGLVVVGLPHGFFFQRLYYLRGFINLMKDFIRGDERLWRLIDILTEYNLELVKKVLRLGVDVVAFGDDLGMQNRMPISPRLFRRHVFPAYKRIFSTVRDAGVHVRLHTDGHVIEVVDQLIEAGVSILNIQDRVNGLDNIERYCKGRVCIDLDIDRQHLLPFGTRGEIKRYLKDVIYRLGSRRGGLMLSTDIYPDVPLENIDSLCRTLEEYMYLHLKLQEHEE